MQRDRRDFEREAGRVPEAAAPELSAMSTSAAVTDMAAQLGKVRRGVLAGARRQTQHVLVAGLVYTDGGDDVVAVHDHSVDVDHQERQVCRAALVEFGKLRGAGLNDALRHRALGNRNVPAASGRSCA